MIQIAFNPENLDDPEDQQFWSDWLHEAQSEIQLLIASWEQQRNDGIAAGDIKLAFNNEIWTKLKKWLGDKVFEKKCAYCETPLVRQSADAEHYRPKAKVTYKDAYNNTVRPLVTDHIGAEIEHPGYFWLAYNWQNLLPSCEICNRTSKSTRFPVLKGHVFVKRLTPAQREELHQSPVPSPTDPHVYYLGPDDLNDVESPAILHPYLLKTDPRHHLIFGDGGIVEARGDSIIGKKSIEVYGLDKDDLARARDLAQRAWENKYKVAVMFQRNFHDLTRQEAERKAKELTVKKLLAEKKTYVAACLDFLELL